MNEMKVYFLEVGHGDATIISFRSNGNTRNILVDGGNGGIGETTINEKLLELGSLDGIIVTHVDDDHIFGILNFVKEMNKKLKNKEKGCFEDVTEFFIIFNKYDENVINYQKGNDLQDEILELKNRLILIGVKCILIKSYDCSEYKIGMNGIPISIISANQRSEMTKIDENNIFITLLTPTKLAITNLMNNWRNYNENSAESNSRLINKSSISALVEFNEKKLLMTGDAYVKDIAKILRIIKTESIGKIDLIKLPHHGSYNNNVGIIELLKEFKCESVFVTADGSYGLPDDRLITALKEKIKDINILCPNKVKHIEGLIEKINSKAM